MLQDGELPLISLSLPPPLDAAPGRHRSPLSPMTQPGARPAPELLSALVPNGALPGRPWRCVALLCGLPCSALWLAAWCPETPHPLFATWSPRVGLGKGVAGCHEPTQAAVLFGLGPWTGLLQELCEMQCRPPLSISISLPLQPPAPLASP